jgi:dTDP-4-dehydrorhamnose reductase
MPRKILVIGRTGQVGWELRHKLVCLGEIVSIEYPEIDLTKPETLQKVIRELHPEVIVNAAAYTAVDKAENELDLAMAINGTAPGFLAVEARKIDALLVHYSTDYVFDGSGDRPWTEIDTPAPLNVYGESKLVGDQAIQASGCKHLIFRTSWVYGARGSNFLLTMLKLGIQNKELSIVDDQIGSPTSAECIAQATANVLAQILAPAGKGIDGRSGVYNLTNGGEASWFDFAEEIFSLLDAKPNTTVPLLKAVPTSAFPRPAQRPQNSRLDGQKLADTFGVVLPNWKMALQLVMEGIEK